MAFMFAYYESFGAAVYSMGELDLPEDRRPKSEVSRATFFTP